MCDLRQKQNAERKCNIVWVYHLNMTEDTIESGEDTRLPGAQRDLGVLHQQGTMQPKQRREGTPTPLKPARALSQWASRLGAHRMQTTSILRFSIKSSSPNSLPP